MSTLDLSCIDRDDRAFVQQRLLPFSDVIQRLLLKEYLSYPTKFERNTYLRTTVDAIAAKLSLRKCLSAAAVFVMTNTH